MGCIRQQRVIGKENDIVIRGRFLPLKKHFYIKFETKIIFYSFSGLVGALGGGFSNVGGYNGLPSVMSGLDDSLSDLGARKKYPFELEKAIHNVMFIQHHMQRMDEFNAVSQIIFLLFSFNTYFKQLINKSSKLSFNFKEDQDWGFVAMVLDRFFLYLFTFASLAGLAILAEAPSLYDDTKPIDIEFSIIAQKLFNLTKS